MIKKVENNKSAFYYKINGFLFGSFKNYPTFANRKKQYYKTIRTGRQPISGIKTMKRDLAEIASENGLQLIETTASRTGYPERLQKAIIGFDTFEQAEELAKENGLSIEIFQKRDGWDLWYRTGCTAYEPFRRSAEDFGDDYSEFSKDDLEDFYENEVQPMVSDFENLDALRSFLDQKEKIQDEIADAEDDEIVITCSGEYYDTIKERTMAYSYDSHSYAIGLIDRD